MQIPKCMPVYYVIPNGDSLSASYIYNFSIAKNAFIIICEHESRFLQIGNNLMALFPSKYLTVALIHLIQTSDFEMFTDLSSLFLSFEFFYVNKEYTLGAFEMYLGLPLRACP